MHAIVCVFILEQTPHLCVHDKSMVQVIKPKTEIARQVSGNNRLSFIIVYCLNTRLN